MPNTFGWLLILFGGSVFAFNLFRLWRGFADRHWDRVSGVVDRAEVIEHPGTRRRPAEFEVVVRYHYVIAGTRYESDQTDYDGGDRYESRVDAMEGAAEFKPGAPIEVHVDPSNPTRAVLRVGMGGTALGKVLLSLALLGFGLWTFLRH